VLLERRLAQQLKEREMILGVFPILIGDFDATTGSYSHFFRDGCNPICPDVQVTAVEEKVQEHLEREGLGSPYNETGTVKSVLNKVLMNQGGFVDNDITENLKTVSDTILSMTKVVITRVDSTASVAQGSGMLGSKKSKAVKHKSSASAVPKYSESIRSIARSSITSATSSVTKVAITALDSSQAISSLMMDELSAQIEEQVSTVTERERCIAELEAYNNKLQQISADLHAFITNLQKARNAAEDVEAEPTSYVL